MLTALPFFVVAVGACVIAYAQSKRKKLVIEQDYQRDLTQWPLRDWRDLLDD